MIKKKKGRPKLYTTEQAKERKRIRNREKYANNPEFRKREKERNMKLNKTHNFRIGILHTDFRDALICVDSYATLMYYRWGGQNRMDLKESMEFKKAISIIRKECK